MGRRHTKILFRFAGILALTMVVSVLVENNIAWVGRRSGRRHAGAGVGISAASTTSTRSTAPPQAVDGAQEPAIRDYHVIQSNPTNQPIVPGMPDDVTRVVSRRAATITNGKYFKMILLWNPFHKSIGFGFGLKHKAFRKHNCSVSACRTTADRSLLNRADAVVFHTRDMNLLQNRQDFPERSNQEQIMVFYNLESSIRTEQFLKPFNDVFNLTMTYRLDSDIPIRHVTLWPRPASEPYVPLSVADMAAKNKMAMWIISHCDKDGTNRWQYVQELIAFMEIDIFGLCGKEKCPPGEACMITAERHYKFYFSLENSDCKDYVTEKLFTALKRNVIPIVHGGLDYGRELPPKSVIKLIDFQTPKHLAAYLKFLDANDEEYLKYFEWKHRYVPQGMELSKRNAFCDLCQVLHDEQYPTKTGFDVHHWWHQQGGCTPVEAQATALGLHL